MNQNSKVTAAVQTQQVEIKRLNQWKKQKQLESTHENVYKQPCVAAKAQGKKKNSRARNERAKESDQSLFHEYLSSY